MDVKTLGQKVKAKYSQYSGMSDEEVGAKMMAKYPQYADTKQDKKGNWIPAVGGVLGGLTGSILGPIGAGVGAAAGTGGGIAIQNALYGDQNRTDAGYTGETNKLGFKTLTPEGKRETGMGLLNNTKDVGVAGVTGTVGALIPGIGPSGTGILPTLGRIGIKTAASSALGAGTGAASPDLQASKEERISGAKTGAIAGGILGILGSVGEEAINVIKNRDDIVKQLANTYKKTSDKVNVNKKIWNKVEQAAEDNPTEIKNSDIVDKLITKAKEDFGESGTRYKEVIKKILGEDINKVYDTKEAIKIGANIPYSPKTSSAQKWVDMNKKDIISSLLPKDVADWKAVYSMNKNLTKPTIKALGKFIGGSTLGAGGVFGYNLLKK